MANIETVREVFGRHFQHVVDLGDGVVRGERQHEGKPYAVAYVDLSDEVVERAADLQRYQERLIGADFFSSDNDLRWNSYLFFWAGPKSAENEKFPQAKKLIESDRHFARKFVLDESDLERRLGRKTQVVSTTTTQQGDAGLIWAELLRADSLAMLLEQRPRNATLEQIEAGEAFEKTEGAPLPTRAPTTDVLANGLLRKLSIQQFRRVHQNREFRFGDVNLITAPNGMGKTSLLEAIEALYCGRVRRDPGAVFSGITGVIEDPEGRHYNVELTNVAATLKARNMAWYGRADVQAQAISQGFTRFNFLDTDAAFRLSSEQDPEQIQLDLGRLIVGPDTTRLWTFLSKLKEDVDARLAALIKQRANESLAVDSLSDEVSRLAGAPSEYSVLCAAFRSGVRALRPKWEQPGSEVALSQSERGQLAAIRMTVDRVLASTPVTPVTKAALETYRLRIQRALDSAKQALSSHDAAVRVVAEAFERQKADKERHRLAVQWERALSAGAPELEQRLRQAELKVAGLKAKLNRYQPEAFTSFPAGFLDTALSGAMVTARSELDRAHEDARLASQVLTQAQELGQTLTALRRDLHDASVAVMGRTGNLGECPVCKTAHSEEELAAKLLALIGSGDSQMTSGLAHRAQAARLAADKARQALEQVAALQHCQLAAGLSDSLTCKELLLQLQRTDGDLQDATSELRRAHEAVQALAADGVDFANWKEFRERAKEALPTLVDVDDKALLRQAIHHMLAQQGLALAMALGQSGAPKAHADEVERVAAEVGERSASPRSPQQTVTALERRLYRAQNCLDGLSEIAEVVDWPDESSLEELQSVVQTCLLAYEKASHAQAQQTESLSILKRKQEDLAKATEQRNRNESARANLTRAAATLRSIVEEHSLETITSEALGAIRSKVSDVFAQIHSPPEYALGNFQDGQLIVRRDDGTTHAVNQVSTGQRAALALSIFLALNESASTAPPVILIDDPVAHIDDLNALSFLDYLRELVVYSRRQVFFATADARLAALFQRKFEFLGPERYRRISLGATQAFTQ